MKLNKLNLIVVALGISFFASACSQRFIITAEDDYKGRATLLQTVDATNYLIVTVVKDVYWECVDHDEGIKCEKVCDRKDTEGNQIVCPKYKTQKLDLSRYK